MVNMKKLILILISFSLLGCMSKEEKLVEKILFDSVEQTSDSDYHLEVKQYPSYRGCSVYEITPNIFTSVDTASIEEPFRYTKHLKHQGVYIFFDLLKGKKKEISPKIFYEIYHDGYYFIDPFIIVLVINPRNLKYIEIEDNQRYLSIDSLLRESDERIKEIL